MLGVSNNVKDEREDDVLGKEKAEMPPQRTEEEKKPSVSVDGFLVSCTSCLMLMSRCPFSPEDLVSFPSLQLSHSRGSNKLLRSAIVSSPFDPNTVSMIILEELPLLVSSSPPVASFPTECFHKEFPANQRKS
ncbi:hypothetical protein OS493_024973 [Desmophyllum pertusum]|uniref:Uncharacterized protein n=1 Tax=Desmophyllum pertusum TaxID=174260 RepID=A0A9W9YLQ1_9CNID|nr:hypothetical protein OS493_024973 [Desmophyllum pertusum]